MAKKYSTAEAAAINSKFGEDTKYKVQNGVLKIKQAMTAREKAEEPTNKKGYVWGTSVGKEPSGVTAALKNKSVATGNLASVVKRSSGVAKTKKGDSKLASVVKKPPMSKRGDGKLASVVKRPPMSKRGDSKIASVVKKPPMAKRGDGKLASAVKRSSGVFKKKTLAPTTSVRPIARTTAADPKKEQGYFVDKKKGNARVRVFPNISPTLYGDMSAEKRKALNLPPLNSTKYTVDFNQRNALTFIIKK